MNDEQKRERVKELMKDFIWADEPIDVVTWTEDGEDTLLHSAAFTGNFEAVKLLVELGADINALGDMHYTPLHYAALQGHNDIYDYLLSHGASTELVSQFGTTPLDLKNRREKETE
ncbi:MAG: ankyrin repeat domain-containing protein [Micavibrio sp.]|nr:MAG: ankyrin repeat domain-containing protein [Micavibrio sp.]